MQESPCKYCKHKNLSKLKPFLWIDRGDMKRVPRDHENGTLSYIPGKNYPNPCWDCEARHNYADSVAESLDLPPTTGVSTWTISSQLIKQLIFCEEIVPADLEESAIPVNL